MTSLDRFRLPFEPDRETYATCANCLDDILCGHEAYVFRPDSDYGLWICGLYCAGQHAAENGWELDEYERKVVGE